MVGFSRLAGLADLIGSAGLVRLAGLADSVVGLVSLIGLAGLTSLYTCQLFSEPNACEIRDFKGVPSISQRCREPLKKSRLFPNIAEDFRICSDCFRT